MQSRHVAARNTPHKKLSYLYNLVLPTVVLFNLFFVTTASFIGTILLHTRCLESLLSELALLLNFVDLKIVIILIFLIFLLVHNIVLSRKPFGTPSESLLFELALLLNFVDLTVLIILVLLLVRNITLARCEGKFVLGSSNYVQWEMNKFRPHCGPCGREAANTGHPGAQRSDRVCHGVPVIMHSMRLSSIYVWCSEKASHGVRFVELRSKLQRGHVNAPMLTILAMPRGRLRWPHRPLQKRTLS
jgi:hypothetical protein